MFLQSLLEGEGWKSGCDDPLRAYDMKTKRLAQKVSDRFHRKVLPAEYESDYPLLKFHSPTPTRRSPRSTVHHTHTHVCVPLLPPLSL